MKDLYNLVQGLSPAELKFLREHVLMGSSRNEGTLSRQFLNLLKDSNDCPSDEACSMSIYQEAPAARYATLKSRFRIHVLSAIAAVYLQQDDKDSVNFDEELSLMYRALILIAVFRRYPGTADIFHNLAKVLRKARQKDMTRVELFCLFYLKDAPAWQDHAFGDNLIPEIRISAMDIAEHEQAMADTRHIMVQLAYRNVGNCQLIDDELEKVMSHNWYTMPTQSRNLHFCRMMVKLASLVHHEAFHSAYEFSTKILEFLKQQDLFDRERKMQLIHLIRSEIFLQQGECNASLLSLAEVRNPGPDYVSRMYEIRFVCSILRGDSIAAEPQLVYSRNYGDVKEMVYGAALSLINRNAKNALKILNNQIRHDPSLSGWLLHVRVLRLMACLELGDFNQGERELEALRKQIARLKTNLPRERKIMSLLRMLYSIYSGKHRSRNVLENTLRELAQQNSALSWKPLSPEVIPVHWWVQKLLHGQAQGMTG